MCAWVPRTGEQVCAAKYSRLQERRACPAGEFREFTTGCESSYGDELSIRMFATFSPEC
jgi:hypothetical protein